MKIRYDGLGKGLPGSGTISGIRVTRGQTFTMSKKKVEELSLLDFGFSVVEEKSKEEE